MIANFQPIDPSKIALLVTQRVHKNAHLVFLKRGEQVWEEKIVACFPFLGFSDAGGWLAADGQWVALIKDPLATRANNEMAKVTLWKEENTGQDIELLGCGGSLVRGIVMELPFLALILQHLLGGGVAEAVVEATGGTVLETLT